MSPHVGNGARFGADYALEAAATLPIGLNKHPGGIHQRGKIVPNAICDSLVEDALVAEGLEVKLQTLEFDTHASGSGRAGLKANSDRAKVRVAGFGADAGEFIADMLNDERCFGWSWKCLKQRRVSHSGRG